jgi:hypothetical protein
MSRPTAISPEQLRAHAQAVVAERKRAGTWASAVRAHVEYQGRPVEWMVEKLGIPEHMIRWSLNPEYQSCECPHCVKVGNTGKPHAWDGDVDPLVQALELVFAGKSVAVSSGTTTSKTFTLGAAGTLCFLAVFPNSTVFSVAPKHELLLKNMWKEIGKLWPAFKRHFPQAQLLSGNLRMLHGEGEIELWAATAFGAGVGAEEELAQRLKGFHQEKMLWIVEEMPGVDQAMVETIIKTASSDFNPIIGLGNPEHQHDPLALFGKREWVKPLRISAVDFPNVVCGRPVIPGGRSRESIARDLADADGQEDDPRYLSQVRGIAPAQSKRALIKWDWCEAAAKRQSDMALRDGQLALGVDVADSPTGDMSCISRWQGACCTEVDPFRAEDASAVAEIVHREITDPDHPVNARHVGIDPVGVGASTINTLKRLGVRVRNLAGSLRPVPRLDLETMWGETKTDEDGRTVAAGPRVVEAERYANQRSQVYWTLREDLRLQRIAIPKDQKLFEELTAIEYEEPGGKITVMPKDDIRHRLGRSPDRADALAYGNWVRPRVPVRTEPRPKAPPRNEDRGLEKILARHRQRQEVEERRLKRFLAQRKRGREKDRR